jgi:hypothetical protein
MKKSSFSIVSFDFPKVLARLTKTRARSWKETEGPPTGCGVDYFFRQSNGSEAYINVDQDHVTITVDGEGLFSGNLGEDPTFRRCVVVS